MINYDILKIASEELTNFNSDQTVKIAGTVRRLVNWFKQLSSEEYRQQVGNLRNESYIIKSYMNNLAKQLDRLNNAIKDADVQDYEQSLEEVKYLSSQLSKELDRLNDVSNVVDIPVENNEAVVSPKEQIVNEQQKEQVSKNVGRMNQPFVNIEHLVSLPLSISDKARERFINLVPNDVKEQVINNENFFNVLVNSIKNGTVTQIYPVKKAGRDTQNYITVKFGPFSVPKLSIKFTGTVLLNEVPGKKLSVMRPLSLHAEKFASNIERLRKIAFQPSGNVHQQARNTLTEAFRAEMKREPTLAELQAAQAVSWLETRYGRGWGQGGANSKRHQDMGIAPDPRAQTSNNWGAVQTRSSKPPDCPGDAFRYIDTRPNKDGTSTPYVICFKSYSSSVEGARDVIKHLFKYRGNAVSNPIANNSLVGISTGMYDTKYYQGFGKTREERIAGHAAYMNRGLNTITKALGEQSQFKDAMENPSAKELLALVPSKNQQGNVMPENNDTGNHDDIADNLINYLFASGPLTSIVKQALENKLLNKTNLKISVVSNESYDVKLKFAVAVSEILTEYLNANTDVYSNGNQIEIMCSLVGDKKTTINAVMAVCDSVSDGMYHKYNKLVKSSISIKGSSLTKLAQSNILKTERKFHLKNMVI